MHHVIKINYDKWLSIKKYLKKMRVGAYEVIGRQLT